MLFGRVKSLEAILATAEKKGLHRSLGAFQLTMLGIGAVIGTGIFVLTAEAAQKAGPGMMISFVIAAFVCGVAALCYSELASMVPVAGSAYTYTYAVAGEILAWMVGWALILEYAIGASAVAVGWSGYFVGLVKSSLGITIPQWLAVGPVQGGIINLPAVVIALLVTWLLDDRHDRERARERDPGGDQGRGPDTVHRPDPADGEGRGIPPLHPEWLGHGGRGRRRRVDLLRLCRLRRGLDRS